MTIKIKNNNAYGERKCPHCDYIAFTKKQMDGHFGGAHRRNITKISKPKCKECNKPLIEGVNFAKWAIKQRNLICISCKNKNNKEAYYRRKQEKKKDVKTRIRSKNLKKSRKTN